MQTTQVVVGTDGSAHSQYALRWAAREARRRNTSLRVLFAFDWLRSEHWYPVTPDLRQAMQQQADRIITDAVALARQGAPGVTVTGTAVNANPVHTLVQASKHAALTVVGNRGHGGFTSLLLGAVGQRVATHAACPVVVVRGRADTDEGPIVVGVDTTPATAAATAAATAEALGVAFEMAAARGCQLTAVNAYPPPNPAWGAEVAPLTYVRAEVEAEAHKRLEQSLTPWRDKYPNVTVEALVARGSPAQVLVGVSHGAQLIVVGSRGHGDLTATMLGSVGLQLLHHADCPVLIVRTHPPS